MLLKKREPACPFSAFNKFSKRNEEWRISIDELPSVLFRKLGRQLSIAGLFIFSDFDKYPKIK